MTVRSRAWTAYSVWVHSSRVRRSYRSAMTPPHRPNSSTGANWSPATQPSAVPLWVSVRTNQSSATPCMALPMLDTRPVLQ